MVSSPLCALLFSLQSSQKGTYFCRDVLNTCLFSRHLCTSWSASFFSAAQGSRDIRATGNPFFHAECYQQNLFISQGTCQNQFTVSLTLIFVSKGAVEWLIWNDIIWLWHNQGSFSFFSWISGIGYSIYKWIRQTFSAPKKWRKKNVGHIKSLLFLRKLLRNDF